MEKINRRPLGSPGDANGPSIAGSHVYLTLIDCPVNGFFLDIESAIAIWDAACFRFIALANVKQVVCYSMTAQTWVARFLMPHDR